MTSYPTQIHKHINVFRRVHVRGMSTVRDVILTLWLIKTNFPSWDGSLREMTDRQAGKEMEESIPVLSWVGLTWHRQALWVGSNNISTPSGVRPGLWTHPAFISGHSPPYLREWRDETKVRWDWSSRRMLSVCCWKWGMCFPTVLFTGYEEGHMCSVM